MTDMQHYDVIVFGAGPAGLAIASELSKELSVLVFDKKAKIEETTKSWLIPDMAISIGEAEDILPFMKNGVRRFLANTFQGVNVEWQANYKYHFAKEHELLNYWGEKIKANGSKILLECWYEDSFVTKERVVVDTSAGNFSAKLLLDCSGGQSPVRGKYAIAEHWYWWSVSGAIVNFPNGLPEGMAVGDYQLWQTFRDTNTDSEASLTQGRPVFEYEILDENSAFVFIFYLGQFRVSQPDMEQEFLHILREEQSTSNFHQTVISEIKYGWYPSGGTRSQKVTRDRVAFVGSSACWTSPCGWGASFIAANYKRYARHLVTSVKENNLSKKQLKALVHSSKRAKYQVLMDQVATHFLSFATASELNVFISLFDPNGELGAEGPLLCEKLFTMTISEDEAASMLKLIIKKLGVLRLLQTVPKQDYGLLVLLVLESIGIAIFDVLRACRLVPPLPQRASGFSITNY